MTTDRISEAEKPDILQQYIENSEHPEVAEKLVSMIFRKGECSHCQEFDSNRNPRRPLRWIPRRGVGWGNGKVLRLCMEHLQDEVELRAILECLNQIGKPPRR